MENETSDESQVLVLRLGLLEDVALHFNGALGGRGRGLNGIVPGITNIRQSERYSICLVLTTWPPHSVASAGYAKNRPSWVTGPAIAEYKM